MSDFTYTGTIAFDTIAVDGFYALSASGAQGGSGSCAAGGMGASVGGDIYLAVGTVLEIVVGGEGRSGDEVGGGGGGSFVFETLSGGTLDKILIGGGGGGAGFVTGGVSGRTLAGGGGGRIGGTGGNGAGTAGDGPGQGGTAGGPGGPSSETYGGGGGGYTGGAGGGDTSGFPTGGNNAGGSFEGGAGGGSAGGGGFGGGAGGGSVGGGGGGGGYGGGGGGGYGGGGGGGSYIDPAFTDTFALGGTVSGDGRITLDLVSLLCYVHGTRILTPAGEVAVEDLAIGDAVVTRFSGFQRIKWLGRQSYAAAFLGSNLEKWPVCIRAGALEAGIPARDLYVSPGHSMLLGDTLVLASSLVNGVTVVQARPESDVHYVQIELEAHDCVVAAGAWAETFADAPGLRAQFHNAAEFYALYPEAPPADALRLCAPRPERGERLKAALRPVVERAWAGVTAGPLEGWLEQAENGRIEGWARDLARPELPVALEILVCGKVIGSVLAGAYRKDLARAGKGSGRCAFRFTPPMRLSPAALATLEVRRAVDGAQLPGTERWRRAG